ncbi:TrmH family RNA methyltransferase [Candidatus Nomurabacteria bacterium]|nr:TrmH family RNA methyltransferase [Candidatus Nomurabacteria bacterium]MCB9819596.1 TrmH family RNA methyltransferase [Candidatus Nomurabacteria bacterium]
MKKTVIILDNIRSAHNVGSAFRTADGAGVEKIYLLGTTASPRDRFGREVAEIKKTSLGASEMVPWEHIDNENTDALLTKLQSEGFELVAVEQTPTSTSLYDFTPSEKTCYIFGNEIDGVGQSILDKIDKAIEIPMKGQKESLNVSVTVGIVLFKNG